MIITFDHVHFKYIEKKLLDDVSFSLTDTDKVGIIGINGTGKSTLLKLITEEEKPVSGQIIKSGGMIINYLPQDPVFSLNKTLLEIVLENQTKEHPIADYEAKSILTKLKLDYNLVYTDQLSGGEKKRLALAKVLVSYSDFLILDEPTNHLDSDLIIWLEKYLTKWKKGLIIVTHDRYFLQRACNKMLELSHGKTYLYDANYEKFLSLKQERLANEAKEANKLKSLLKKEAEWVNRGVEARRTKSKSRLERFEKLSSITFNEEKTMSFSSKKTYLGKKLIEIKNASKAFGDKILFNNFSFSLLRTDIVGIVGENGAGKSTLFKIIMQQEKFDEGELILGETLKIGYFSQNLDLPDSEIRVIDYIKEEMSVIETLDGNISASDLLTKFLFDNDLKYSKVKMLSGGEKRRLQLIRVLMTNPNLLILDEPTNDLDIYTIEILEDYLENFKGPILIVSHDRYFLDKLTNKLLVFENTYINEYNLSFSEFLKEDSQALKEKTSSGEKPKRNRLPWAIKTEYQKLSIEIPIDEEKLKNLKESLAKETTDYLKMMDIQKEIDELETKVNKDIERLFEIEEIKSNYEE